MEDVKRQYHKVSCALLLGDSIDEPMDKRNEMAAHKQRGCSQVIVSIEFQDRTKDKETQLLFSWVAPFFFFFLSRFIVRGDLVP